MGELLVRSLKPITLAKLHSLSLAFSSGSNQLLVNLKNCDTEHRVPVGQKKGSVEVETMMKKISKLDTFIWFGNTEKKLFL